MRHLSYVLYAAFGVCTCITGTDQAHASQLGLTLDLIAPATPCNGGNCPADINLPLLSSLPLGSSAFNYAPGQGSPANFVATVALDNAVVSPIVCDEIAGTLQGPTSTLRFAPAFTNPLNGGGALEFGAGGTSNVDLSSMAYDGSVSPPVVRLQYINTTSSQVLCYPVNRLGTTGLVLANSSMSGDRVFSNGLDGGHVPNEPWLSVQTVNSPSASPQRPSGGVQIAAQPNDMVYVVQIHNPVAGWHLDFADDTAYFSSVPANWCVLTSIQPGAPTTCGNYGSVTSTTPSYKILQSDIQTATNSVYVQVVLAGSPAATSGWGSLTTANFPALAAIFPPTGTYPQRLDDKVAVASANNLPTLNIGSITCPNTTGALAGCSIADQDGHPIPAGAQQGQYAQGQLTISSQQNSGAAVIDPIAYVVDPNGGTTLPSIPQGLNLPVPTVSCPVGNGIVTNPGIVASTNHVGGWALQANFVTSGNGTYVAGSVVCTATYTPPAANGLALPAVTQSFTITMLQTTASHFVVSAPSSTTAGAALTNITVTALDGANNPVTSYGGTVHFTSNDPAAALPPNALLTNGTGTFSGTLKTAGSRTITATDTQTSAINGASGSIAVSAAAATQFSVNAPPSATTGVAFNISVAAYDQFNNLATGYVGTAHFTSTDAAALLPVDSTLTFGVGTFSTTLITPGTPTITATDTVTPSITGTSGAINVN